MSRLRLDPAGACLVALAGALAAGLGLIGADARWLAAVGNHVSTLVGPRAVVVPQTAMPTHWVNVPVLAELIFRGLESLAGDRGLVLAQTTAVVAGFTLLWLTARRHASAGATFVSLLLVVGGALPAFLVARSQLFSLALFPALLYLLTRDEDRPGQQIWMLVPLVAVWSNLHGAVLTGVVVAGFYLSVRAVRRPVQSLAVLAALPVALCATPALWRTPDYYRTVLDNQAARRGVGLWAPLSLHGSSLLLIVAAVLLLLAAGRSRLALWELTAFLALALLTIRAERGGVWLLMAVAPSAARGLSAPLANWHPHQRAFRLAAVAFCAVALAGFFRGPLETGAAPILVTTAVSQANGRAVLAEAQLAEQVMLAGGRVVMADPLDAYSRHDQNLYLDWLAGRPAGDRLLRGVGAVLVAPHSPAARRLSLEARALHLHLSGRSTHALLYLANG